MNSGALYDPKSDSWTLIASSGNPRISHTLTWSGSRAIAWGGQGSSASGDVYDPSTNSWKVTASAPISSRFRHAAAWSTTTGEMIIWGGLRYDPGTGSWVPLADGAAYNLAADTWSVLPAAPIAGRESPFVAWTGTEMLIAAGSAGSAGYVDGARFNPVTRAWTKFAAAPLAARHMPGAAFGLDRVVLFGGQVSSTALYSDGAILISGAWKPLPSSSLSPATRAQPLTWFDGSRFCFWSGWTGTTPALPNTGACYVPATDAWSAMPGAGAFAGRAEAAAIWTGEATLIWGGVNAVGNALADGALFVP